MHYVKHLLWSGWDAQIQITDLISPTDDISVELHPYNF